MTSESELSNACFELLKGAEPGLLLPLAAASSTLGRVAGNTIVLNDTAVSRQHAKVFVRDGRHWIADLNSSHGTFVNGAKVTLHALHDGDEVRLGNTVLRYVPAPKKAAASAEPAAAADREKGSSTRRDPGAGTGAFELEPPAAGAPGADGARRAPLPPVATGYRRALTREGEDPFADEPAAADAPAAPDASPAAARAAVPPPRPAANAQPQVELRGETARQFAARGTSAPPPAAAAAAASTGSPSPRILAAPARAPRSRGPFTFLRDELDQRGPAARAAAALFALATAAALFWLVLRLFEAAPKSASPAHSEEPATAPQRPVLPPRK
jgi:predicted component of type VI protein secretion system